MVLQNSKDILYSSLPEETSFTSPTDDQGRIQLRVLILCAAIKSGKKQPSDCVDLQNLEDPNANKSVIPAHMTILIFHSAVNRGDSGLLIQELISFSVSTYGFILNGQVKQHDLRVKRFQPDPIN
ncbi:hypothetical protein PSTT_04754, partial [Puccinia striiformis]